MPWNKQFDVDAAQRRARDLFWTNGYEATSIEDLLDAMGIGRSSFYATFGGKQLLYAAVLERYDDEQRRSVLAGLRETLPPRDAIRQLFAGVRDEGCARGGTRGCFLVNAALELGAADPAVGLIVRRAFAETETFFASRIATAIADGAIGRDADVTTTARALVGLLLGMRVLARAGASQPALDAIVRQVDRLL